MASSRSSSARIASRSAGTTSHSASYPLRMFARRFCSDWMWFARFCDGESRVPFAAAPLPGAGALAACAAAAAAALLLLPP